MPICVRLDKETETLLEETAADLGTSKAFVIKESLRAYCPKALAAGRKKPYELIRDIAGRTGSGRHDLSSRSEEILREAYRRKR